MWLDHINSKALKPLVEPLRDFCCSVLGLAEGFRPDFGSAVDHVAFCGPGPVMKGKTGRKGHA